MNSVLSLGAVAAALIVGWLAFAPVPVGYDRGKIRWNVWCWAGMHTHSVYWWGGGRGFQSMHPVERDADA